MFPKAKGVSHRGVLQEKFKNNCNYFYVFE